MLASCGEETIQERAEAGDVDAQNNLGEMYETGDGVPRDFAKAIEWYRKSAEQGNADAKEWLKKNAKDKSE